MITVLPEGGLCNRMRVVASAWLLATAAGQSMRVIWYRTPDFNSRFDEIFATHSLPFEIIERSGMSMPQRALFRASEYFAAMRGETVFNHENTRPGQFNIENALTMLHGRNGFIHTNSRLSVASGMFSLFMPVGYAAERIAELRPRLERSVGVHVRGTDNVKAKAESPLTSFIALMNTERLSSPATDFFIATDEPAALAALKREFGESAWEYPKRAYARNDQFAITDAVVDLFALGACNKLFGSYWSSFTDTASELHGIPCVIARA